MNPIIFLDIDGVLNPEIIHPYTIDQDINKKLADKLDDPSLYQLDLLFLNQIYYGFDHKSCAFIKELVDLFDAKIVLTSSWRILHSKFEITKMFEILGIKNAFIDCISQGDSRANLIKKYLFKHPTSMYIIIDDMDLRSAFGFRFIQTFNSFNESNFQDAKYAFMLQQ